MTQYYAFIDESGNHDLDTEKNGVSNYFIVLAIIAKNEELNQLEENIEKIRKTYFFNGEMKSSNVKDDRRVKILNDLKNIDFKFYAVAIDKSAVYKDSGLKYKKSFIKFSSKLLYETLFKNFPDITIFADAHGGVEFIESFKNYIENNYKTDLFSESKVEIVDSKNKVLVQLADFMVGSIAKIYENRTSKDYQSIFLDFLKEKKIRIDEWPPKFDSHLPISKFDNEFDYLVYSTSINKASNFIKENFDSIDQEIKMQCDTLKFLLFQVRFESGENYISTAEIIEHLNGFGYLNVTEHFFRSNIVSRLRDHDVIIASSNRGYKIPTSYKNMIEFTELVDGKVIPLLNRLHSARKIFQIASLGKMDFLDNPKFIKIHQLLNAIDDK